MIKKFTFFAFLFLFACVGYALAQEDQQQQPEDQQQPAEQQQAMPQDQQQAAVPQNQQLQGLVHKIDPVKKTITIKDEITKTTQDLDFNETTTFNKAGNSVTVSELQKGDKITVEVDSQNLITKVEIGVPEVTAPPEQQKQ